jgi:undecaprenyl-phosphate 4-deoxy-4-formamido-L-arabinose transferase
MSDTLEAGAGGVAISVVIPVYNEEAVLTRLFDRLYTVLDGLGQSYEAVFVDDGSRDRSGTLLRQQYRLRPDTTRVVYLPRNIGQHNATMAGFRACVGRRVVTLDADLQNPPEEIPRLLAELDQGHDYVGSIRRHRNDNRWRELVTGALNGLRERIAGVRLTDPGCLLRAYDRQIVEAILGTNEVKTSVPALACLYAVNPTEILVGHAERAAGQSKHPRYRPIHLHLDLMTGFSLVPLQLFSLVAMGVSLVSFACVLYLVIRWVIAGPEADGLSALFGVLFFFGGGILFGIGLLGQYIGHLLDQNPGRPNDPVREELIPRPVKRRPSA